MFISIKYNKYLGKDAATGKHLYEYTIVDSDFTVAEAASDGRDVDLDATRRRSRSQAAVVAVIQEYGKRNLNVAANLARLAQFIKKTHGYSFEHIFNSWKLYVPEYKKYENEMQKYLILL